MQNERLVSQYMQFNKILLATLNIKQKTVDVFDGKNNMMFDYKGFFEYVSKYFELIPNFIDKALVVLETIDKTTEVLEIDAEYKKLSGEPANFNYHIIRQNDDEFLLSVKERRNAETSYLDQMTKANPKSYIDNRAKNNMLSKTPFVVMYIDIDGFKHINDEYGQLIGDMILIEMVSVAKSVLGDKGAISRIGGDRFLVIYDIDDDYDTVHNFIFDIKQQMQHLSSCISRGLSITLTIGSAQFPSDGPYELLLKKCHKALIRGKNKGRDCFIMYLEEKCGKVTLDDEIDDKINKIDNLSAKNDIYSLITNVNQLLADEKGVDESVDRAISLICNYFYIDRVSIARLNIKNHRIMKHHACYNPKISVKYEAYCINEIIPDWGKALGSKGYIRIDDSRILDDTHPLKKLFEIDHTLASMSFELIVNGKSFGLIRFDMTTGPRHWQPEDFQIFLLLSQLFASYFQKNYLKETNYKTLYLDPKYGCHNFIKMFSDTGEFIISKTVTDYSILEFDIRNIIKYRNIIGKLGMLELSHIIIKAIEKYDCIYGKHTDGAFDIFFNHQNKEIIENFVKSIREGINRFTKEHGIHELALQVGVYLANANTDTLIDAIANTTLTRTINKTDEILYYSEEIKNQSLFRTEMVLRLDEALENNEFLLYLQPKISTSSGKLVGAEALTRWKYKHEKILFPDQFISLFEEQGVIEKLDFLVFKNVCRYQKLLIDNGLTPVPISVNVSRYISDFDKYLLTLEEIRKEYQINSSLIEVEITEGMYYENSLIISDFISKLHNIGYKVSMDDFGAGYSNLVSMAKLKFDVIKFDRSFCLDLDNSNVRIMLDKLIELIKTLKMSTICEGVETKENVEYLTKIGCDSIQGYYYSKPIPWDDFKKKYYS